jgi:hypothetical protein
MQWVSMDNYKSAHARQKEGWPIGITDKAEKQAKKTAAQDELWQEILKNAAKLDQEQFVEKHPREWILRRAAMERLPFRPSIASIKDVKPIVGIPIRGRLPNHCETKCLLGCHQIAQIA